MNQLLFDKVSLALSLFIAGTQGLILIFLIKRKMRSSFPIFFAYNAYAIVAGLALLIGYAAARVSDVQYFYFYAVVNAVLMALEFGVMFELVVVALKPYGAIIDLGKMLFRWAGLFLLVAACLTASATVGSMAVQCAAGVDLLTKSLRLMQCGLLFLFFLFERRLSLSWRSRPVSIALGIGVSAAIGLCCSYFRARYMSALLWINILETVSYLAAVVYWAVCFAVREPQRTNVLDSPSRLIFQRWDEALAGYGYGNAPSTVESFLPGIEKTVDRVMARRVIQ
jgi:hypothetical protein